MHHEEAGTGTHTASAAHNGGEVGARPQPVLCRKHSARAQADSSERPLRRRAARIARPAPRRRSDGEALATLAAATRKDLTAVLGAHPLAKAVGFRPTAVVGLERPLAHVDFSRRSVACGALASHWKDDSLSAAIESPRRSVRGHAKTAEWPRAYGTAASQGRSNAASMPLPPTAVSRPTSHCRRSNRRVAASTRRASAKPLPKGSRLTRQ